MNLELYHDETKMLKEMKKTYRDLRERSRKIGEGREAFRKMLETYVPQVGYSAPEHTRILNLGCGVCYEAFVLSGYFGGKREGYDSKDVLLVGIDIDAERIENTKQLYSIIDFSVSVKGLVEQPNYRFIHGDARKLRGLVDGEYDLIIARHPNVCEIPDAWDTIFRNSNRLMKSGGLFLATSYSDFEHEMLKTQVQNAGYKLALNTPNKYAIPTSHKEVSIDRNILLARK